MGETTRPAKAKLLKAFENKFLKPISTAIKAKDKVAFETAYKSAILGCNSCHQGTDHGYVRVQLPPAVLSDYLHLPQ